MPTPAIETVWEALADGFEARGLPLDDSPASAAFSRIERVVEAAWEAERHLRFNAWKNDSNSDRRLAAINSLAEVLGALDVR